MACLKASESGTLNKTDHLADAEASKVEACEKRHVEAQALFAKGSFEAAGGAETSRRHVSTAVPRRASRDSRQSSSL